MKTYFPVGAQFFLAWKYSHGLFSFHVKSTFGKMSILISQTTVVEASQREKNNRLKTENFVLTQF